jgi:putative transposase
VLEVSTSGYYAWLDRTPSKRAREDAALSTRIRELHRLSDGTYGSPRLLDDLADDDLDVSRKRVARLMKELGLQGVSRRRFVCTTTRSSKALAAPDLVRREFRADGPHKLWVADITYVPTWSGFLYLAVVLDVWSRRIVGWAMRTHLRTELVAEALEMALARRKTEGVIHHSDQGFQYTSIECGRRCREAHVRPSMGTVGDCFDNAMCESFFATLECELLDRKTFRTQVEARMAVFSFIEGFYNPRRRHSAIGNISPMRFETRHADSISADEVDGTFRFRGTEELMEPLRGSTTSPQPVV